jgi:hypothetical protein
MHHNSVSTLDDSRVGEWYRACVLVVLLPLFEQSHYTITILTLCTLSYKFESNESNNLLHTTVFLSLSLLQVPIDCYLALVYSQQQQ